MKFEFEIDKFYHDANYGVVKHIGQKDGKLLFERYDRSLDNSWAPTGQRVNIDPQFQQLRAERGKIKPILPPQ